MASGSGKKQTRTDTVMTAIRNEVLAGRVPPATKLRLAEYSDRFEVSLSVTREAMGRLAEQGLLQANPQRGFSTLPLSIDDLSELTRARIVIETATFRESMAQGSVEWEASVIAAHHRLAATAADDGRGGISAEFAVRHKAFHRALLAGSGNAHLEAMAASLRDRSELYQYWSRYLANDDDRDVACEHAELCDLAVAREADAALLALEQHIQRTTDSLLIYARRRESGTRLQGR